MIERATILEDKEWLGVEDLPDDRRRPGAHPASGARVRVDAPAGLAAGAHRSAPRVFTSAALDGPAPAGVAAPLPHRESAFDGAEDEPPRSAPGMSSDPYDAEGEPGGIGASTEPIPIGGGGAGSTLPEGGCPLEGMECELVRQARERAGANQSRAARLLSISRDALRYKMKKFNL